MTIYITVFSEHLTDETTPDDELQSASERYCDEILRRLAEDYPEHDISIDLQHHVSGSIPRPEVIDDNGDRDAAAENDAERITEQVFEAGLFWVELTASHD